MTAISSSPCTILVVDDDVDMQELLRVALRFDGYDVASARTGRDALDYLRSHAETCAILLDLMLPGMDGAQFRALQRRDRSLAWIPVIVMSSAMDLDRRVRDIAPRMLVRKPVDLDELRRAVRLVSGQNCGHRMRAAELAGWKAHPYHPADARSGTAGPGGRRRP